MPNLVTLVTVSDQSRKLGPFGKYQSQILNFVAKADSDMQILLRKMHCMHAPIKYVPKQFTKGDQIVFGST